MQQFILCMRCETGANTSTHATSSLRSKTSSKDSLWYEKENDSKLTLSTNQTLIQQEITY